ncbi:MAG TPA: Asp-tRNA(Asn)/Glu-tRNA(Gln) amidotransferase subunit GatC [Candidatus Polarisedimenticolia bacterium]|nr:Asp-tRNA(Asn)/Glu-tRNA(Gln) amidotransferase subunit GatC [Candidatus Polarisedimenticolia bacterium]
MKISLEEVKRVAALARLSFSDGELETLRGQLDGILEYIGKLDRLATEGVEPAVGPPAPDPRRKVELREDALSPTLSPDEALANAPESDRGHFKVPKVMG